MIATKDALGFQGADIDVTANRRADTPNRLEQRIETRRQGGTAGKEDHGSYE